MDYILMFVAGMVVGWNFLQQPEWVAKLIEKIKAKFSRKPKDDVPVTPPSSNTDTSGTVSG